MKKILMSFMTLFVLSSVVFADCSKCPKTDKCNCKDKPEQCENKTVSKCNEIEDDEYYIYNQCYFDKHFKEMKKILCLTQNQEKAIDNIYKCFKRDMEKQHTTFRFERAKLLEMLECNQDCYKNQISVLKELKKETKELCKCFKEDIEEVLCKNQQKEFRKFMRKEKRHMKKIIKYSLVVKLPCVDCCKKYGTK